jgi:hypothetical protein
MNIPGPFSNIVTVSLPRLPVSGVDLGWRCTFCIRLTMCIDRTVGGSVVARNRRLNSLEIVGLRCSEYGYVAWPC